MPLIWSSPGIPTGVNRPRGSKTTFEELSIGLPIGKGSLGSSISERLQYVEITVVSVGPKPLKNFSRLLKRRTSETRAASPADINILSEAKTSVSSTAMNEGVIMAIVIAWSRIQSPTRLSSMSSVEYNAAPEKSAGNVSSSDISKDGDAICMNLSVSVASKSLIRAMIIFTNPWWGIKAPFGLPVEPEV